MMIFFLEQLMVLLNWLGVYLIIDSLNPSIFPAIYGVIWITIFFELAVFVRKKLRRLWQIFLAHVVVLLLLWTAWHFGLYLNLCTEVAVIAFLAVIINMFININDWRNRYPESFYETQPLYVVCPAVMYVYGIINKDEKLLFRALVVIILIMALHLTCKYMQGTNVFFISNKEIEELPEKAIKNSNAKIISIIIVGISFLMLLAGFFRFDSVFARIGLVMMRLVLWAVYYIDILISMIMMDTPEAPHATAPPGVMSELSGSEDSDPFTNKLVALVGITALFIVMIRLIIGFFRRRDPDYYKNTVQIVNKDWVEVREDIKKEKPEVENYPNDEKGRIRRKYKKEVKRKMSGKLNYSMTTGQILEETDKEGDNQAIRELTPQYDKARYDK